MPVGTACLDLALEPSVAGDPRGDASPAPRWRAIADRRERLRVGLTAIYGWFERNAEMTACVLRDAEFHALTREIATLRMGPSMTAYQEVLGAKLNSKQRAMLHLALSFFTWRTLVRDSGVKQAAAIGAMADAVVGAR